MKTETNQAKTQELTKADLEVYQRIVSHPKSVDGRDVQFVMDHLPKLVAAATREQTKKSTR